MPPMPPGPSETETVVKRILPYLRRRGYDETKDFSFESQTEYADRYERGYVDILVTCGQAHPLFLIEAKRISRAITKGDEQQALDYGKAKKVPFVVITNGREIRCLLTSTGRPVLWDGSLRGRVPARHQLAGVMRHLRAHPENQEVSLDKDESLPFRPGLPLRQLNRLFAKCHTWIRNIEKKEDDSFADFSKILFLKLLEEKADAEGSPFPYSYRFWKLAETPPREADQVKDAIERMIAKTRKQYGDVLGEPLKLGQAATFLKIVQALAQVSFTDSKADVKGAAFEYFVRATLKGKKLGQYFTPRPLVQLMVALAGRKAVTNALLSGTPVRVVDPACGTGGFLVFMMQDALAQIDERHRKKEINAATRARLHEQVKRQVFHGADANQGVASAAKMNMIIAGDGHANIYAEDSLASGARIWRHADGIDLVITNPPFGTSESDSLGEADRGAYRFDTSRGQLLFIQRMLRETKPEGIICTVIDEGVLNTDTAVELRRLILELAKLRAVVRLPDETFKPNKINVRSAVLLLERRAHPDPDLADRYPIRFIDLESLGYDGAGTAIRGFRFERLQGEVEAFTQAVRPRARSGYHWSGFVVNSRELVADGGLRMDLKYWLPPAVRRVKTLKARGTRDLRSLNRLPATTRGRSPAADLYVDARDGFARVLKAGSSITPYGEIAAVDEHTDFIERDEYETSPETSKVIRGDVLLASTGTGTLGKAAVYESDEPAVADGHVTILRVDRKEVLPRYLADYLRAGFGRVQIERLYTGSTGLIELAPQQVDAILVELPTVPEQRAYSAALRKDEKAYRAGVARAREKLAAGRKAFAETTAG
jgi:type I restriction enzyme M protein